MSGPCGGAPGSSRRRRSIFVPVCRSRRRWTALRRFLARHLGSQDVGGAHSKLLSPSATSPHIFFTWFFIYLNKVRGLDLKAKARQLRDAAHSPAMATFSALEEGFISGNITSATENACSRCWRISVVSMAVTASFIVFAMQAQDAARGQSRPGRRRRRTVSRQKLLLVSNRRHRGRSASSLLGRENKEGSQLGVR